MTFVQNLTAFSDSGEYLAYSSPDGCLKIWETATGILKQEYTPSSHLSATCSSLSWGPFVDLNQSKRMKRFRTGAYAEILNLRLIAMGTMTGDILLYSFANADLCTHLSNGHTGTVNDVVWYSDTLYSCSNDHHIIIWDVAENSVKIKWKANTGPIFSICVIDDNNILSASNSIQWWDIKQKAVLKIFNGHGSEIFRLLPLNIHSHRDYFVSAAVGDRVINAWHLKRDSSTSAIASFVLSDEPAEIDILSKHNEPVQMSVVSQDGSFNFFEHTFSGKSKKPLQPKFSIQIASKSKEGQKAHSLPILAAKISSGLDLSLLAYGSFLKPLFERINISDVTKDVFLIRSVAESSSGVDSISKIKQTEKSSNVKLLTPGHMTDVSFSEGASKKRKKKDLDIKELPMEERLKALDLSTTPKENSEDEAGVKSDSMIHLLLQGLQSKDNNMLSTVLCCSDQLVINNTVERLPIQSIFPLLEVLFIRLHKLQQRTHPYLKWFTALITIHLPYFISSPDISKHVVTFDQFIVARRDAISQLARARGILKILMSQAKSISSNASEVQCQPLLEYASESSEESDAEVNGSDYSSEEEIAQSSSSDSSESDGSDSESGMEED